AIRSPAGAVTAVTAVLLAPAFLAPLLTRLAPGRRGSPGAADEPGGGSRVSGSAETDSAERRLSGTVSPRPTRGPGTSPAAAPARAPRRRARHTRPTSSCHRPGREPVGTWSLLLVASSL